jgi:hypothetical protein
MKTVILFLTFTFNSLCIFAVQPNTIDNTVKPCDDIAATSKPDCNIDAGSIKIPPKTLDEKNGIIIKPKKPLTPGLSAKPKIKKENKLRSK